MAEEEFRALLDRRRRRAVATLMGHIEREVNPRLGAEQRAALRDKVIEAINNYHDVALDALGVLAGREDGTNFNEEALAALGRIEARVVNGAP